MNETEKRAIRLASLELAKVTSVSKEGLGFVKEADKILNLVESENETFRDAFIKISIFISNYKVIHREQLLLAAGRQNLIRELQSIISKDNKPVQGHQHNLFE